MENIFDVKDKCVVITGGAGILCGEIAIGLARLGAKICVVDYDSLRANEVCKKIEAEGNFAIPVEASVLDKKQVKEAFVCALETMGRIDVLINGAGGNKKEATCGAPTTFFELDDEAIRAVFDLNCMGTMIPSQVFGEQMAKQNSGNIINLASMNAFTPLTNIAAYSAAKAAIANFTQWLATYMAQRHSTDIRVNAIAPGFFLTKQNEFLLMDEKTGGLSKRGQQIIDHTPMGRFGAPEDLLGTMAWLISDASKFVTGTTIPIDGGFNAFSGV